MGGLGRAHAGNSTLPRATEMASIRKRSVFSDLALGSGKRIVRTLSLEAWLAGSGFRVVFSLSLEGINGSQKHTSLSPRIRRRVPS